MRRKQGGRAAKHVVTRQDAVEQGMLAARNGEKRDTNPYAPEQRELWVAWASGYESAARDEKIAH